MDKCHNLRNRGEYEGELNIDDRIITDRLAACKIVTDRLDGPSRAD